MRTMLAKLAPFAGTIAATMVFFSWLITHTLEERAESASHKFASLVEAQRQSALYERLITVLNYTAYFGPAVQSGAASHSMDYASASVWVRGFNSDIIQTVHDAAEIHRLIQKVSPMHPLRDDSRRVQERLQQLQRSFITQQVAFSVAYGQRVNSSAAAHASQPSHETGRLVADFRSLAELWSDSRAIARDVKGLQEKVVVELRRQADSSRAAAERAHVVSYLIFAFGSTIALAGKWTDERRKSTASAAQGEGPAA